MSAHRKPAFYALDYDIIKPDFMAAMLLISTLLTVLMAYKPYNMPHIICLLINLIIALIYIMIVSTLND